MLRLFWIAIAVLAIAAGAVVLSKRSGAPKPDKTAAEAAPQQPLVSKARPRTAEGADAAGADDPAGGTANDPPSAPAVAAEPNGAGAEPQPADPTIPSPAPSQTPSQTPAQTPAQAQAPVPDPVVEVADTSAPAESTTPSTSNDEGLLVAGNAAEAQALIKQLMASADARATEDAADLGQAQVAVDPETVREARIEQQPDGSMLVDDVYVVKGSGTKDDPYRVSWDMLISAQQTYNPRLGQEVIPGRVQMLHDKYISVTGYLAFPIAAQSVSEALCMLNQWDGCCIGVPPSPYDAVEARLSTVYQPVPGHMMRFGTVTGQLKVDPYIVNNWLVGLYLMEDAEVRTDAQ
ncbi:MAG: hypothetical protein ACYTGR_05525 [Planctomycetota bacterium]|jgi:hypothetical protein